MSHRNRPPRLAVAAVLASAAALLAACQGPPGPTADTRFAASPVAPLLPPEPALVAAATVTHGPTWLAVSMPLAGATLYLEANTTAVAAPELAGAALPPPPTAAQPRVFENERIWQADWIDAAGVAWSLHLECADTVADPRCGDGAEVLRWQRSLRPLTGWQP